MHRSRKWLAAMVCLVLLLQAGLAGALTLSFSPGLTAVSQRLDRGHAYGIQVEAQLAAWPDLNPETLEALQAWLAGHQLAITLQGQGESRDSLAALLQGQRQLLTLSTHETPQEAQMLLGGENQPLTRYLGTAAQPPWQTLLGLDTAFPDPAAAGAQLISFGQAALPFLTVYEKPVKTATTIKNVGRGSTQMVYTLKKDEALLLYQEAREQLLPPLKATLEALLPGQADSLGSALDSLQPDGSLTIKRILDKEDQDLGLQITGQVQLHGKARRLTLFGGVTDSGLYLSLRLPATRGNDTLSLQLSILDAPGQLKGDWRYESVTGKDRHRMNGSLSLTSIIKEGVERVTGKITGTSRRTGGNAASFEFLIKPDLEIWEDSLTGSLLLQELSGKKAVRELTLRLSGQPAPAFAPPAPMAEIDLNTAESTQLPAISGRVQQAFIPVLTEFLMGLPLATRQLVLHDLGRDQRTQGDSVPAGILPLPTFVVTDESIPTTKEENP